MESRVRHPGAEQVLPLAVVGDGCGIFPGRLPFMCAVQARSGSASSNHSIRPEDVPSSGAKARKLWKKG